MNTSPVASSYRFALALSLSLIAPAVTAATEVPWKLEQDEGGIQVYTRPVANSPFLEVKATALIKAPITHVAEIMGDGEGCSAWRTMCKSSEVLGVATETERYVYLVLDMPWPVSDRDMVIHSTANIDLATKTVTVQLQSASDKHPEQDYVRAVSNGQYLIRAVSEEQAEFTYIMHTNLGGDLPANLINPRMTETTFDDVKRLQALAEK